jgi:hypothetical protein
MSDRNVMVPVPQAKAVKLCSMPLSERGSERKLGEGLLSDWHVTHTWLDEVII